MSENTITGGIRKDSMKDNRIRNRRWDRVIASAAMFLLIIAVLITSVQLAAYGDPQYKFYEKEYTKYTVTDALDMKMKDVMKVTDHMMAYLIGEEEKLSVVTNVDGKEQDFFNEQDRLHMADVKNLFLGGLRVRLVCLVGAAILIIVLIRRKAELSRLLARAYSAALGLFVAVIAFLGIAFSIDFTRCFTIFHKIFFTNDLWLFDPATDYMIRMLPEGFFSDMVLRIGIIFLSSLVCIWVAVNLWKYVAKKYKQQ